MADIKKVASARHLRGTPTLHVRHLRKGKVIHDGVAQSFWFRALTASLSEIPIDDRELPLLFHVRTADFQDLAVQATVTYRIADPGVAATRIDFGIDPDQGAWRGRPLDQLAGLLTETAQQHAVALLAQMTMQQALAGGVVAVRDQIAAGLVRDERLVQTGIQVVGARVTALNPEPEVARALQTTTRELLQQEADKATFERRAVAVERERAIGENELQTKIELARREEQLVAQSGLNERRRAEEAAAAEQILVEGEAERDRVRAEAAAKRDRVVTEARAEGTRLVGEAQAVAETARLAAYQGVEAVTLFALAAQQLAANLPEIGTLNLTPDVLTQLVAQLTAMAAGR
jgi:regulator of protease activity HflC (stomatin/prohibitin superfamily)